MVPVVSTMLRSASNFTRTELSGLQRHILDGAHPDARDANGVPGFKPRRILEDCRISVRRTGSHLAEDEEQECGQHRHHNGEDAELD